MNIELTQPIYLWGILLAGLVILIWRRSLVTFTSSRRHCITLLVRLLLGLTLLLTLAGTTLLIKSNRQTIVFLLDHSLSIDDFARRQGENFINNALNFSHKGDNISFQDNQRTNWLQMDFAATVRVTQSAGGKNTTIPSSDQAPSFFNQNSTNISEALELAAAQISPERAGKIILLSDGNENQGDALTTVGKLGIPISTVLLSGRKSPEVQMVKLSAPDKIRHGEPFFLETIIRSNQEEEAIISLYRGEFKILEERRTLQMGENHFLFQQTAGQEGKEIYSAIIDCPNDTLLNNNKASKVIAVGNRPQILFIDNEPESVRPFISLLKNQDFDIELRSVAEMPNTLNDLHRYDVLFLSNIASNAFSQQQEKIIKLYVSELGGGLIVSGGDRAFQSFPTDNANDHNVNHLSTGDNNDDNNDNNIINNNDHNRNNRSSHLALSNIYNNSVTGNTTGSGVFSDILPVRSHSSNEKKKSQKALALLIDRSGSMTGKKLEMSKEATLLTARHLTTKDYLSVIAFDSQAQAVIPVHNINSLSPVDRKIESMTASGGTKFIPALILAQKELLKTDALEKHIILLTDGQSEEDRFEDVVKKISSQHISLSTVGIGKDADHDLLRQLAHWGNGRHYVCNDPAMIPKIFLKETDLSSNTPFIEEPFIPQKYLTPPVDKNVKIFTDDNIRNKNVDNIHNENVDIISGINVDNIHNKTDDKKSDDNKTVDNIHIKTDDNFTNDLLSGIDFELVPPLLGYVKTESKPTATTILTTENEEPLLVCWRYGLGQVIAFTSDVKSRWGAEWLVWSEAPSLWGQIIRHSIKYDDTGNFSVKIIRRYNTFRFILDARDKHNDFINQAEGVLTVITPDLSENKIVLKQIAPGCYSAEFDLIQSGICYLHWLLRKNNETLLSQSKGFVKDYSDELQLQAPNKDFMKRIADLSGGSLNPSPQSIFTHNDRTNWQAIPLWPWLLTFALFLYLLDVYLRRTEQNRLNAFSDRSESASSRDNISISNDHKKIRQSFFHVIISILFQWRSK